MQPQPESEDSTNKNLYTYKYFFEENQINQINQISGDEKRSNQSFHMKPSIASIGREYAKVAGLATGEFAEKAFIDYIIGHPLDIKPMLVQQMVSSLPQRRDVVHMKTISRKLETFMRLIDNLNGNDSSKLEEKLLSWVARGNEVKNPSEEFVELLERALKYV